ncbi:MAG: MarR family transcriptional regulator [Cytophagales bacterium CG18_big_fil_WC_8_21_14_2_50_42_9]|nr:MAG: MarR family transcriptional regulator [Cytophagales bacterium CG18_big_fil_WC_8_21_14_2_50_42_9]
MRLEEEIKQPAFKDEYQKVLINVFYTSSWLQASLSRLFKKYDLTMPQFNLLRILRGQYPKPATINLLIERMLDKTSNASRLVDKLEAKNLVTRKQCPNDRRTVDVLITQAGLDLLSRMDEEDIYQAINNLTEPEARQLNLLLDKIRQ